MITARAGAHCTICLVMCSWLAACQPAAIKEPHDMCGVESVSARCILRKADDTLNITIADFDWVSGAAEMAIAYDSLGETQRANDLIDMALTRAPKIFDAKKRGAAVAEILTAITELRMNSQASVWLDRIAQLSKDADDAQRATVAAKSIAALAVHDDAQSALEKAIRLPQQEPYEENEKAKVLRKLATVLAKNGDYDGSINGIEQITMSISYYQAMVRSDVARLAAKAGRNSLSNRLLSDAETIARDQDNGYFIGAALRDIGYAYQLMGQGALANRYFDQALSAARDSDKQHEKARAISRIATRMADGGQTERCRKIISDAAGLADLVDSDVLRAFSFYEIAGSAAFCGEFDLARRFVERVPSISLGSTASLSQASERDLAWGLARFGRIEEAVKHAAKIYSPREKMQAYSRIVRVIGDPKMEALPRYP